MTTDLPTVAPQPLVTAPCTFAGDCGTPAVAMVDQAPLRYIGVRPRPMCQEHLALACRMLAFPTSPQYLANCQGEDAPVIRVDWLVARAA